MPSNIETTADRLKQSGIVAIIRGDFGSDQLLDIAAALAQGGVTIMEVTLNSRDALRAIRLLRGRYGDSVLVGAGTVRTEGQVDMALANGAQFIVSPNFDPASVARSLHEDVLHLPGVSTVTEAQNAFMAGCQILKLFPADVLGGPAYLKALRAPLDDIDFAPTGGIHADNVGDYVRAGAVAVGVGSWLVSEKLGKTDTLNLLAARAAKMRASWEAAKG
jgi:2-dehydro-3-deoxyphosphogluconate aldolase/(4S)-4-hydroxy-2-oxoglutarate aldolase